MVTFGILAAFGLFMLISYKKGIDVDFSLELFLWVVPLAVVFCRVFYVVPRIGDEYRLDSWQGLWDMINISNGGLTIIGGIFGGALGIFFCCLRNRKYTFAQVADCVVIALFLGQIIGRWGNFFNQELYGVEVTQEWMKHFPLAVYIESSGTWHYANFFYEGVLNAIGLAIALVIFFVPKKPVKTGTVMLFYVGWYGLVRGSLEFIKGTDPMTIGNTEIKMVQLICYIMFIVAIVLMILLQVGKIRFETKWFQRLCEKKREADLAKQAAAEGAAENGDGMQSDAQSDRQALEEGLAAQSVQSETAEITQIADDNAAAEIPETQNVQEASVDGQEGEVKKAASKKSAKKTTKSEKTSSVKVDTASDDGAASETTVVEKKENPTEKVLEKSDAESKSESKSPTAKKSSGKTPAKTKAASASKTAAKPTTKKTSKDKAQVNKNDNQAANSSASDK